MLKLFYKTLLVSLLSGSLLMLDFSYKGASLQVNSVRAETLKTEGVGGDSMMATLTMTAVGLLASRLYRYKMTTDIMLAAAGGAAFIAGDILAVFKNKDVMKDLETEIMRDDKGKIDQKQIETLEKLKKSYMAAKDTANTKKMLQMAAAAAFAAAGIAAYMMTATEETQQAQCLLGLQNAASTAYATDKAVCTTLHAEYQACTPTCTGPQAAACLAACTASFQVPATTCDTVTAACKAKISSDMSLMTNYITARETPSPSATGLSTTTSLASTISSTFPATSGTCTAPYGSAEAAAEAAGVCPAKTSVDIQDASGGSSATLFAQFDQFPVIQRIIFPKENRTKIANVYENKSFMEKTLNFFIPEVRADLFSPMGIASSLAIKFILATNVSLATTLDLNLLIPKRRAIAWGVLAGLTYAASSATDSEIGKIQSNIDKIDAILNSMYALANGVTTANGISSSNATIDKTVVQNKNLAINANAGTDVDLKANGGGTLPCITGDNPDKCPSFSGKLNAQADVKAMPDIVQQQVGSISKLTDGINGASKISASTLSQAQSLAGQSNALRAEFARQQKAVQEKLKLSGSKVDLAKDSAKLDADIRAVVQKELDSRKMSASDMLASFSGGKGGFGSSSSSAVATDANKNTKGSKKGVGGAGALGAGTIAIPAATAISSKIDGDAELNASLLKDKKDAEDAMNAQAAKTATNMDDYALKNDITQDKESSIFELISNRYQKSGYQRLFKRVK